MKNNTININFIYLQQLERLNKNEFGAKFGLKKSVFGNYIRENRCNNAEFLIKLAQYYNVKVEDLVYADISKTLNDNNYYVKEPQAKYGLSDKEKNKELKKRIKQLEHEKKELLSIINIFKQQSELIINQKQKLDLKFETIEKQLALLTNIEK